ncbi:MAG: hypothetical protein ABMB14_10570 [Myxococcota bacterium]
MIWGGIIASAFAAPDAFAPCEDLFAFYVEELRPRPAERPVLWWIEDRIPCAPPAVLTGAQPPNGRAIGCEDRNKRTGWRTEFGMDGKVMLETHWDRNREIGPRREWDPITYEVVRVTELHEGRLDGETIEWLPDGGVLITNYHRGIRDGATWRLDERNNLVLAESWRNDRRHGRSCTWRGDALQVDQVYDDGAPTL